MGQILAATGQEGALPGLHGRLDGGLLVHGQVGGRQLAAPALAGDVQGDGVAALLRQGIFQSVGRLVLGHSGHVQAADAHVGQDRVPAARPGTQAQIAAQHHGCGHACQHRALSALLVLSLGRFFDALSTHAFHSSISGAQPGSAPSPESLFCQLLCIISLKRRGYHYRTVTTALFFWGKTQKQPFTFPFPSGMIENHSVSCRTLPGLEV